LRSEGRPGNMSSSAVLEQFRSSSRDLFLADVISSHGGNLSVRQGDRILITRRGSMLARLNEYRQGSERYESW
jgi:L-fuculose-phosphate aldolase